MTERQALALRKPCARADEAMRSEFYRARKVGSISITTILTVNK